VGILSYIQILVNHEGWSIVQFLLLIYDLKFLIVLMHTYILQLKLCQDTFLIPKTLDMLKLLLNHYIDVWSLGNVKMRYTYHLNAPPPTPPQKNKIIIIIKKSIKIYIYIHCFFPK